MRTSYILWVPAGGWGEGLGAHGLSRVPKCPLPLNSKASGPNHRISQLVTPILLPQLQALAIVFLRIQKIPFL